MPYTFHVPLVGTRYRPIEAQVIASELEEGDALHLELEPTNPYDPNAIKVIVGGTFIGYIPAKVAAQIVPILDKEAVTINAEWRDDRIYITLTPFEVIADDES